MKAKAFRFPGKKKNPVVFYFFDQIKSILRDTVLNNVGGKNMLLKSPKCKAFFLPP